MHQVYYSIKNIDGSVKPTGLIEKDTFCALANRVSELNNQYGQSVRFYY